MNNTITLAGSTVILRPVQSPGLAVDLSITHGRSEAAGLGAALGLCWPGKPPWETKPWRYYRGDLYAYGMDVFDAACKVAHPLRVQEAGWTAFLFALSVLPAPEDTEEAEQVFPEAGAPTSETSSPFAETTEPTSIGGVG